MEPLILKQIYKEKPWGSKKLPTKFKGIEVNNRIGEIWEVALVNDNISEFENTTINLKEIFNNITMRRQILGEKYVDCEKFPILLKTLFIQGEISLQVHPDNRVARKYENDFGKNEAWYVLYADKNSYASLGLKDKISKKELYKYIADGTIVKHLKRIKIETGDVISIPAGTIHSISGNVVLYEIQQNSNITYRVHDKNGRSLDIEKAIIAFKNNSIKIKNQTEGLLLNTKYFKVKKLKITKSKNLKTYGKFSVITVIEGDGCITSKQQLRVKKGMTILIPANLNSYRISGNLDVLIAYQ